MRRLTHGVYCPTGVWVDHETMCQAVALVAPAGAVITGASALTVHGVPLLGQQDPVHLVIPKGRRSTLKAVVRVSHRSVRPAEATPWRDRQLATPLRAAFDLLLGAPVHDAVPALDRVLRSGLVPKDELAAVLRRRDRGVVLARQSLELADPRAESPPESWVRVVLVLAGLTPVPQYEVRDELGRLIARVDLGFPEQRVAVEYEGEWHGDAAALVHDRERLNRLRENGWMVVFVTKADRYRPSRELVGRVLGALAAAE